MNDKRRDYVIFIFSLVLSWSAICVAGFYQGKLISRLCPNVDKNLLLFCGIFCCLLSSIIAIFFYKKIKGERSE
jgi:hypothetical protein